MHKFDFEGIGTLWSIEIFDFDINKEQLEKVDWEIKLIVDEFDKNYSRFKDSSFVGRLNSDKILEKFPTELFEMITFAEKVSFLTHGNFDICVGEILEKIGYDQKYSFKPQKEINYHPKGIKLLEKDRIELHSDTKIDLGAIGKGWLIDKISDFLKSQKIQSYLINGGGDIYGTHQHEKKIKCFLENPFNLSEQIGTIKIKNQALASSAPNRRSWIDKKSGKKFSHLILKNSKLKDEKKVAVYTIAKTATLADTLSTAIFVSNIEIVEKIYNEYKVEFMIIFEDNTSFRTKGYNAVLH